MEKYVFLGLLVLAALILCVQIITEVFKLIISDKSKYNVIVLITSIVLTVLFLFAFCAIMKIKVLWYSLFGAIVLSFFVACGAMIGYDKLMRKIFDAVKEFFVWYKKYKDGESNGD